MSNKYSVDHKEVGIEFLYENSIRLYLSVVINNPITTVELLRLSESGMRTMWDWGMSYCRPDDEWNPVHGVSLAVSNMFEKASNYPYSEEFRKTIWEVIEPLLKEISEEKWQKEKLLDIDFKKFVCGVFGDIDSVKPDDRIRGRRSCVVDMEDIE